jgi:hypothetical protein
MLPIVGVPATIHQGMAMYRDLFCRDQGFEHIERYVTGLILSPNKTLHWNCCTTSGRVPSRCG